jgi:hypothetical protein
MRGNGHDAMSPQFCCSPPFMRQPVSPNTITVFTVFGGDGSFRPATRTFVAFAGSVASQTASSKSCVMSSGARWCIGIVPFASVTTGHDLVTSARACG